MKFGIFTYGSRGDVQPYIALALGLLEKGHEVLLAGPVNHRTFVEDYGVEFYSLHGDFDEILFSHQGRDTLDKGRPVDFVSYLMNALHDIRIPLEDGFLDCSKRVDVLIVSNPLIFKADVVGKKLDKKWAMVEVNMPILKPMEEFPPIDIGLIMKETNEFCRRLDLPENNGFVFQNMNRDNILHLYGFSPALFAPPDNWNKNTRLTGFFTLPGQKRADNPMDHNPPELEAWMSSGPKPIFIGFGSIGPSLTQVLSPIITDLLQSSPERIALCTGRDMPHLPDHQNLLMFRQCNHDWLLPKCKAAVFHGGAGTLAATLRAGIPAIVASLFGDQPLSGEVVVEKGIGVHIPWKRMNAEKLREAFVQIGEPRILDNVAAVGSRINREDGVATAVKDIEEYFCSTS